MKIARKTTVNQSTKSNTDKPTSANAKQKTAGASTTTKTPDKNRTFLPRLVVVNNPDVYPETLSTDTRQRRSDSCVCYRCGACCQDLPNTEEILKLGIRGDNGDCINFDAETRSCRIYSNRPTECNIVEIYTTKFRGQMNWEEYAKKMMRACYLLRQSRGIEEPDNSPYRNEAVANAQRKADGGETPNIEEEMDALTRDVYGDEWLEKQIQNGVRRNNLSPENFGYVLATKIIVDAQGMPNFMYRETPVNNADSGWRFCCGKESEEYLSTPSNIGIYPARAIINLDESILPFLSEEIGVSFNLVDGRWQRTKIPTERGRITNTSIIDWNQITDIPNITTNGEQHDDETSSTEKELSKWL